MIDAVEGYLERCAQVVVDIEVVESLLTPERVKECRIKSLKK